MSDRKISVKLGFEADTSKARKQIEDLYASLGNIGNKVNKGNNFFNDKDFQKASKAATDLQNKLQGAFNVNTGKINISKFAEDLKRSGKTLSDYRKDLAGAGSEGQAAFSKLTRAIASAELPTRTVNQHVAKLWENLQKTAAWQFNNAVIRTMTRSFQNAYQYAEKLNKSLNSIRIVTGKSEAEMKDFAKQANNAAKALSTSTRAYTDASLIFFQQGLTGEDVTQRVDTVIKLSNVTGQSAEEVSSYMTAIWNNFDDGSESLEHYADVITKLGATTAASSREIAQGLEKFAAIGQTVGLSYDYATSALAAVVANTRQSADMVGTSFKTIFSRLQSLSLGETLEDGLDLTKYSNALKTIGVSVTDANGKLKNLDTTLAETAKKWQTLTNAQQAALAQTVAGSRQYTQFVALMNSWDDVETNLETARNSDGSLQEQADIYAESWEGARKRVQAAAESMYSAIIDDKTFIKITSFFGKLIEQIKSVVDGFGGFGNILLSVGGIFMNKFAKNVPDTLQKIKQFTSSDKKNKENLKQMQDEATADVQKQIAEKEAAGQSTESLKQQEEILKVQQAYGANLQKLTQAEREAISEKIKYAQSIQGETEALERENVTLEKRIKLAMGSKSKDNENQRRIDALKQDNLSREKNLEEGKKDLESQKDEPLKRKTKLEEEIAEYTGLREKKKAGRTFEEENRFKELHGGQTARREELKTVDNEIDNIDEQIKNYEENSKKASAEAALKIIDDTFRELDGVLSQKLLKDKEELVEAIKKDGSQGQEDEIAGLLDQVTSEVKQNFKEKFLQSEKAKLIYSEDGEDLFSSSADMFTGMDNTEEISATFKRRLETIKGEMSSAGIEFTEEDWTEIFGVDDIDKIFEGKEANEAIQAAKKYMEDIGSTFADKKTELDSVVGNMEQVLSSDGYDMATLTKSLRELGVNEGEVAERSKRLAENVRQAGDEMKKGAENSRGMSESMTKLASGLTSSVGAFNSMKGLADSFSNGNIAGGLGGISGLFFNSKNILGSFKDAGKGITSFGKKLSAGSGVASKFGGVVTKMGGAVGSLGPYFMAAAAAAGIAAFAIAKHREELKKNYEQSKAHTETLQKEREEYQETAKNLQELRKSYNDLTKDLEENSVVSVETRNKVVDLCLKYNQQELAVKALTSSYEGLTDAINQANAAAAKDSLDASNLENDSAKKTLAKQMKSEYKSNIDKRNLVDFADNNDFDDIIDILNKELDSTLGEGHRVDKHHRLNVNDFAEILAQGGDDLIEQIQQANKGQDFYDKFIKGLDLSQVKTGKKAQNESLLTYQAESINTSSITDAASFENAVQQATEQIMGDKNFNNLDKNAEGYAEKLNEVRNKIIASLREKSPEFQQYGNRSLFISQIIGDDDQWGKETEQVRKYLNGLTDAELEFFASTSKHVRGGVEGLEEYRQEIGYDLKMVEKFARSKDVALFKTFFDDLAQGKKIDVDSLFSQASAYTNSLGEKESFKRMSTGGQMQALTQGMLEARQGLTPEEMEAQLEGIQSRLEAAQTRQNNEYKGILNENTKSQFQEMQKDLTESVEGLGLYDGQGHYKAGVDAFEEGMGVDFISSAFAGKDEDIQKTTELFELIKDVQEKGLDGVDVGGRLKSLGLEDTDKARATLEAFGKDTKFSEQISKYIGELNKYQKELDENNQKEIDQLLAQKENAEAIADTAKMTELLSNQYKEFSSTLSTISSSYQALNTAVAEYNLSGSISLSTLNSIMEMDNSYLAALEVEGNQMSINAYNYDLVVEAMKNKLRWQAYEMYQNDLDKIAQGEYNTEVWKTIEGTQDFVTATGIKISAILSEAEGWKTLASAVADYNDESIDLDDPRKQEATKAFYARLAAVEAGDFMKGGGSGKSQKKDKKYFDDEFDRFYPIKKHLEDIADLISDIDKKQQHLFGGALVKSLRQQNALLVEQKNSYKELLKQQNAYGAELRGKLRQYGMTFGEDGNISNYKAVTQHMLDEYNKATNWYNNSSQDEIAKDSYDKATKSYEKFKKLLSQYQQNLTDETNTQNNIDDTVYKQIENNLKTFETKIKLQVDLADVKKTFDQFTRYMEKDFKKALKSAADWMSDLLDHGSDFDNQSALVNSNLEKVKNVDDVLANSNYKYGTEGSMFVDRSEALQYAIDAKKELMENSKALKQMLEDAYGTYLDQMEDLYDQWDAIYDKFDSLNTELAHSEKVLELIGGNAVTSTQKVGQILKAQQDLELARQQSLAAEAEALKAERAELLAKGSKETDKDIQQLNARIDANAEMLRSSIESYLETAGKAFENNVQQAKHQMEIQLFGDTIDNIRQEWDDAKLAADGYYDDVQKVYQLEKLQYKWQEAIDDSSVLKHQQQLAALMERQRKTLSEKTKLSEKDVALAEKEIELYKAQIALEEAQNNKNSMKVVRDQSGNWSYQYVADEDDINDKRQAVLDANDEYRTAALESYDDSMERALDLMDTLMDRVLQLKQQFGEDYEGFEQAAADLVERYYGDGGIITSLFEDNAYFRVKANEGASIEIQGLYENDRTTFEEMTLEQQHFIQNMTDSGILNAEAMRDAFIGSPNGIYPSLMIGAEQVNRETVYQWRTMAADAQVSVGNLQEAVEKFYGGITEAHLTYCKTVATSKETVKQDFTDISSAIGSVASRTQEATDKVTVLRQETDKLSDSREYVTELENAFKNVSAKVKNASSDIVKLQTELAKIPNGLDPVVKKLNELIGLAKDFAFEMKQASGTSEKPASGYTTFNNKAKTSVTVANKEGQQVYRYNSGLTEKGKTGASGSMEDILKSIKNKGTLQQTVTDKTNKTQTTTTSTFSLKDFASQLGAAGKEELKNTLSKVYSGTEIKKYLDSLSSQDRLKLLKIIGDDVSFGGQTVYKVGNQYLTFATGGYTGTWPNGSAEDNGKLAFLHQKELVLNKEDTENILDAVSIMRNVMSALGGMSLDSVGNKITTPTSNSNTSNNVFNIQADFPNANNAEEIKQALLSLPNLASQYLLKR